MDPFLYKPIFLHLVVLFSLVEVMTPVRSQIVIPNRSKEGARIISWALGLILWLGLRPVSWAFGDTGNYARTYLSIPYMNYEVSSDPFFYGLMKSFALAGIDVHLWFFLIEAVYIGGSLYAVYKLFPYRTSLALAVVLSSFSFYSYGVNGIRNGMACAMVLMALPFLKNKKYLPFGILALLAFNTHSSVALPLAALGLASVYKNTKIYFYGWMVCIVLAVVAGGTFENLFIHQDVIDTGFDASYYNNENTDMSLFSHRGFRYDFLLYSCVPIGVGYYFVIKQKWNNAWYKILLNTYIICNSVWVLVNQNWLSNRIAYLSWFMYGYVLMYPLLMCSMIKNRDKKVKLAVLGNAGFSYFMWIIGKYM